jgi:hypothetical protein
MNIGISLSHSAQGRYRATVILIVAAAVCFLVSLVVFVFTEQWTRRVLFFPEVNSKKYAAEVRYLPPSGSALEDIRGLLGDLLLGPSNFGYAPVLPANTRLLSAMLEQDELYVGFSKEIFQTDDDPYLPRERLQAVADTVYFNFPWVRNVHFFIGGKELLDGPVEHLADRKLELARALVPALGDLPRLIRIAEQNPLFDTADADRNTALFHDGARWDESILK